MSNSKLTFLKPCPFCGAMPGKIESTMTNEGGQFRTTRLLVVCTGCGIEFDIDTLWSRKDAVDKWNRRTGGTYD